MLSGQQHDHGPVRADFVNYVPESILASEASTSDTRRG
jgi:hypothetical protein